MLNKSSLKTLLESRFNTDSIKTLALLPSPTVFIDMQKAVKRTAVAIKNNEKITVIGDYDVDGVSSSALIKIFFNSIGYDVEIIIPNRFQDGYGLSVGIIEKIQSNLVITVDNGIMALEAAEILTDNGADLIIIDHHTIGQKLPNAIAIVHPTLTNPKLQVEEICAATVVWYFVAALKNELGISFDTKQLLHLVAIATIADVMPLVCINRTLVKAGLAQLNSSNMPFAKALRDISKTKITSEDIAFRIAPRLNSAGRMSDGFIALEFLSAKTIKEATAKLEQLNALNEDRKKIEFDTYEQAKFQVSQEDKIIVVCGENWHEGVLGIVASRLVSAYKKPAIVLSEHNGVAKGSARSIGNVNIFELLNGSKEFLKGFGGHKAAAGLNLESSKLQDFKTKINSLADSINATDFESNSSHLGEFDLCDIDLELCDLLDNFEPYGQHNEKPKFVAIDKTIEKLEIVGKDQNVAKITISHSNQKINAVFFGQECNIKVGDSVNFIYNVTKNSWGGQAKVELTVQRFL